MTRRPYAWTGTGDYLMDLPEVSMPDDYVREVSKKILERIRGDQQTGDVPELMCNCR